MSDVIEVSKTLLLSVNSVSLQLYKIMTKAEIVNEISLKTGADRKETLQIVKGFMNSVKKLLANE